MIGERIKELRKENNLTQKQLADAIGIDRSSIGKYETGTPPSSDVLLRIAEYFGVSVDYLYGRVTRNIEAENDDERELLVMFRKTNAMTDSQRKEITDYIKSTIKMYIKATGADGGGNADEK